MTNSINTRLLVLAGLFLATAVLTARANAPETPAARAPLSVMSMRIGEWSGRDAAPLSAEVLEILGADDHLDRIYYDAAGRPTSLFVGYYASQRQGDTIHSPMNCLPGAGWQPVSHANLAMSVPGRDEPVVVNRYLIQKGADRQVVLYWYQSHGRVVASEYWSKAYLIYDAARFGRSDAALVRIVSPVFPDDSGTEPAERRAIEFAKAVFPRLDTHIPSH